MPTPKHSLNFDSICIPPSQIGYGVECSGNAGLLERGPPQPPETILLRDPSFEARADLLVGHESLSSSVNGVGSDSERR